MMSNPSPCDGCGADTRSSCRKSCHLLHKFLREDPDCHTRVRTTEQILPGSVLTQILDWEQVSKTRLTLADYASAMPGYWDIELSKRLTPGEKALTSAFYVDGMSYKQIAVKYRLCLNTVKRHLIRIKEKLRKHRPLGLEDPSN